MNLKHGQIRSKNPDVKDYIFYDYNIWKALEDSGESRCVDASRSSWQTVAWALSTGSEGEGSRAISERASQLHAVLGNEF